MHVVAEAPQRPNPGVQVTPGPWVWVQTQHRHVMAQHVTSCWVHTGCALH